MVFPGDSLGKQLEWGHLGMRFNPNQIFGVVLISTLAGCVPQGNRGLQNTIAPSQPILNLQEVSVISTQRPAVGTEGGPVVSPAIQVIAKVNQEVLLSQEFLYGADLQYSSSFDSQLELYSQSMAIGHIPTHFTVAGDELRLVADNRVLFPSDVNHPEQLISRFKILARTTEADGTTTLTISGANSGVALSQIFAKSVQSDSDEIMSVSDSWIRSFEFIQEGNYILQQTSITLADGTLAEFMESIFPAKNLEPGSDFTKFKMNPTQPASSGSGPSARYRLLAGERIYEDEEKVAYAQHFDFSPKADGSLTTLDFYVTPNIPDTYIDAVKNGIEGWNRYFLSFKGIQRPVIQFKGKLPEGIHLGDPRYNVIAWDNRKIAGAAYESQAADPRTGKQSHTIIYLPSAWVNIGNDYWKGGKYSEPPTSQLSRYLSKKNDSALLSKMPRCDRNLQDIGELTRSGRLSKDEIKIFGIQTLTQTLFHEVGHALGAAHNFKGSLNYNPADPKSLFSTSIMDYNDYEIERQAFESVDTWKGPLLEYDRQIMSTLYNQGRDVLDSDPVLPACADAEADRQIGGVDPFCTRYDVENDPTHSIITALQRFTQASSPRDTTLTQALKRIGQDFTDSNALSNLKTEEDFQKFAKDFKESLLASIQYYLFSGKASIARALTTNIKSLLQFQPNVVPQGMDEGKIRAQTLAGLMEFLKMDALPAEAEKSLQSTTLQFLAGISKAPIMGSVSKTKQNEFIELVTVGILTLPKVFKLDPEKGLPRARAIVLGSLKRRNAPFFLGGLGNSLLDVEQMLTNILYKEMSNSTRTTSERVAAATSLASFKGRSPMTDQLIQTVTTALQQQRDLAQSNDDREEAIILLKVINPAPGITLKLKR